MISLFVAHFTTSYSCTRRLPNIERSLTIENTNRFWLHFPNLLYMEWSENFRLQFALHLLRTTHWRLIISHFSNYATSLPKLQRGLSFFWVENLTANSLNGIATQQTFRWRFICSPVLCDVWIRLFCHHALDCRNRTGQFWKKNRNLSDLFLR